MIEYFRLTRPDSSRLPVVSNRETPEQVFECPTGGHRLTSRSTKLALEVSHNRRDTWIISTLFDNMVFHARLLEEFEKRGITGYRLKPATVRFRDGVVSDDYSELIVTGWAGIAPPESGIELTEACGGCGYKH